MCNLSFAFVCKCSECCSEEKAEGSSIITSMKGKTNTEVSYASSITPKAIYKAARFISYLNWSFAVFCFLGLLFLLVLHLSDATILLTGRDAAKVAPDIVYFPGYFFLFLASGSAFTGIEAINRRNMSFLKCHVVFSFLTVVFVIVVVTYFVVSITGNDEQIDPIADIFVNHFNEIVDENEDSWVRVQDRFECCGTDAVSLFNNDIEALLTGEECENLAANDVLKALIEENSNSTKNEDGFIALLLTNDFEIFFCREKIEDILKALLLPCILLMLVSLMSLVTQMVILRRLFTANFFLSAEERRVSSAASTQIEGQVVRNSRHQRSAPDLLEGMPAAGARVTSLAPELKNIYAQSFKIQNKKLKKVKSENIINKHYDEFIEEEDEAAGKELETVDINHPRNKPRQVSFVRFPGQLAKDSRKDSTNETLERVHNEKVVNLNNFKVESTESRSKPTIPEVDDEESEETDKVRDTNITFL